MDRIAEILTVRTPAIKVGVRAGSSDYAQQDALLPASLRLCELLAFAKNLPLCPTGKSLISAMRKLPVVPICRR